MSHQSTELLRCPFCGSAATLKKRKTTLVSCTTCTATTFQTVGDKTSAITDWNTRAIASVKREPLSPALIREMASPLYSPEGFDEVAFVRAIEQAHGIGTSVVGIPTMPQPPITASKEDGNG